MYISLIKEVIVLPVMMADLSTLNFKPMLIFKNALFSVDPFQASLVKTQTKSSDVCIPRENVCILREKAF